MNTNANYRSSINYQRHHFQIKIIFEKRPTFQKNKQKQQYQKCRCTQYSNIGILVDRNRIWTIHIEYEWNERKKNITMSEHPITVEKIIEIDKSYSCSLDNDPICSSSCLSISVFERVVSISLPYSLPISIIFYIMIHKMTQFVCIKTPICVKVNCLLCINVFYIGSILKKFVTRK